MKTGTENLQHFLQRVEFSGQEDQHSVELYSDNVTIVPSCGGHDHGSSKVKLKNMVDFTWEHRFYFGQLLAVHMSGKYLAYGINVASGGAKVRVVYKELEQRALLRGMQGTIQDLAFAYVPNAILACVDYLGNLFVNSIKSTPTALECNLILQVNAGENASPTSHRVIWCSYIPEDDASDSDEVSKLLLLTRGSKAELWSIGTIAESFRSVDITNPVLKATGALLEIDQHTGTIVEATFSPDGTALATASLDGEVVFFQVCTHNNSDDIPTQPRCIHQWRPHGGRPISCLFFLDDHKNYNPEDQFWRFAVTGCDNNSELKIWSCELWTCLQTIKFDPIPSTSNFPVLKAGLDLSAGYLLLSDIYNKVLYILSLTKDTSEAFARVSTISEFLLPYPMLSFGIVDAGLQKIPPTSGSLEDLCPADEEAEEQLVITMYLVQPKSLQECHIAFKPASQVSGNCLLDTLTHDSMDYSEDLPDMGTVNHNGISGENCEEDCSLSATTEAVTNHNSGLGLIPPDAFSSPAKKENNEIYSGPSTPQLVKELSYSPALAQAVQALNASEPPLPTTESEEQAPASSGSSPSREVRQILSLTKPDEVPEEESKPEWSEVPLILPKWGRRTIYGKETEEQTADMKKMKESPKSTTEMTEGTTWKTDDINTHLLAHNVDSVLTAIQDQRQELRELRAELTRLRQETPVTTRVESALTRASQQQNATLEQTLYGHVTRQHELFNALETKIKDKIENTFPRIVEDTVAPLKHQFRADAAEFEELLKENLTKLITSAHMKEALAAAAASAAKPALDLAFKEAFTNILLPGMEKACQTMFKQVQEAFIRGTREYLQNVDAIAEKQYQQRNEKQSEALSALVREELQAELARGLNSFQDGAIRTIRDSIRDHLSQQLIEISGARPRATTPAIPVPVVADAQARIMSLLQRGQLSAALQQALSASDLGLVVLVCEKTEPSRVFSCPVGPQGQGTRCILPQPVILSLVQQLSADLGHRTELKHRWLEEAILNLDPNDPVTREHMGTILLTLQNQLAAFAAANPNHRSTRRMKMLGMAAQALLSQHP